MIISFHDITPIYNAGDDRLDFESDAPTRRRRPARKRIKTNNCVTAESIVFWELLVKGRPLLFYWEHHHHRVQRAGNEIDHATASESRSDFPDGHLLLLLPYERQQGVIRCYLERDNKNRCSDKVSNKLWPTWQQAGRPRETR